MQPTLSWSLCLYCLRFGLSLSLSSTKRDEEDERISLTKLDVRIEPRIAEMEKIRTVKQGDRVALECEAFGAPPPAVWWKRNGVVVKPPDSQMDVGNFLEEFVNAGLKTYEQGSTKSRLDISCFTAAQQGEYECVADNLQVSRANVSLKLAPISSGTSSDLGCPSSSGGKALGRSPVIHMWTNMRVEVEGVHVQLFCRADGFPRPQVTWLKQDIASDQLIQLEDSKDFKFLPNGDLMVVGRSVCNPGGCALVCRATNSYGEDEVEIFLYQTRDETVGSEEAS